MPAPNPTQSPSLADLVLDGIATALYRLRVAQPGVVLAYNAADQTVDVQPAVADGDYTSGVREAKALPVARGCPVASFFGGQNWWITHPISVGDTGTILFMSSSIDRWNHSPIAGA